MDGFSLHLDDIACIRGDRLLFAQFHERVDPGGCLILTGPNGCGKSTLLRVVAGLARPFTGTVSLRREGTDFAVADHASYVGHRDGIKAPLTVREHLNVHAALHGTYPDVTGILKRLALDGIADLPGRVLSAGQRRRLALARLLAAPSSLWVLDEPTVGIDQAGIAVLEALLQDHRTAGGTVVVSTHTPIAAPDARTVALHRFAASPSWLGEDDAP
jgi:heme exporter protein A